MNIKIGEKDKRVIGVWMKKFYLLFSLLLILCLSGCGKNDTNNEVSTDAIVDADNDVSTDEGPIEVKATKTGDVETVIVEKWRCVEIGQKAGEEEKNNINIFLYLTNNNDLILVENDKTYSCELTDKNWGFVNFDDEYLINWPKEEDGRLCLMRETQKKDNYYFRKTNVLSTSYYYEVPSVPTFDQNFESVSFIEKDDRTYIYSLGKDEEEATSTLQAYYLILMIEDHIECKVQDKAYIIYEDGKVIGGFSVGKNPDLGDDYYCKLYFTENTF